MNEQNDIQIDQVSVKETWESLAANAQAVLIDVRTYAEWSYVGCVDLSAVNKRPILLEWITFPEQQINSQFISQLKAELGKLSLGQEADLYFLCRSGARSQAAAKAMTLAGYSRCYNVIDGFEGSLDAERHRGSLSGWKAEGLPWVQS